MFDNIRMVLINTTHPGNIGSAARAMKTMGFSSLYLVEPALFPHPKANEMASSAAELLDEAVVVSSLDEALADCTLILGTSARSRAIPWPVLSPREIAPKAIEEAMKNQKVAILFGREQRGLTNEELQRCHYHIHIQANPDYSSLNLASAVQVLCYELRMTGLAAMQAVEPPVLGPENEDFWDFRLATSGEMEGFFGHLEETLVRIDFLDPESPRKLMMRMRRLFNRARPDMMEVNILRGMLTAVGKVKG